MLRKLDIITSFDKVRGMNNDKGLIEWRIKSTREAISRTKIFIEENCREGGRFAHAIGQHECHLMTLKRDLKKDIEKLKAN